MKPIDLPIETQILWLAAEIVERGHCKGTNARDANGAKIGIYDTNAVAWCIVGALCKAGGAEAITLGVWSRVCARTGGDPIHWNDHPSRTAEEVALALRTA